MTSVGHTYVDYFTHLYQTYGDNILGNISKWISYSLSEFLDYQDGQIILAKEAGVEDERWLRLAETVALAREMLDTGSERDTALAFLSLGESIQSLRQSTLPKHIEVDEHQALAKYKRAMAELKRTWPLEEVRIEYDRLKEFAQRDARAIWANDTDQEFRLHEMAELVTRDMNRFLSIAGLRVKEIGEKTVRRWISGVAPDYAKKPGRPRRITSTPAR